MRNQFFLLTVLAVTFWTGRGDQTQIGQRTMGQREDGQQVGQQSLDSSMMLSDLQKLIDGIVALRLGKEPDMDGIRDKPPRDDFYLDEFGSGGWSDDESDWDSSLSEYDYPSEDGSGSSPSYSESEEVPSREIVYGSMHLNKVFKKEYLDRTSLEYSTLETSFIMSMHETMENSPLSAHYIKTVVHGFSPGSVKVSFDVELENFGNDEPVIKDSVSQIITDAVNKGRFDDLSANASSLVVRVTPFGETTTPSKPDNEISPGNTEPAGDDDNTRNTNENIYRDGGDDDDEVDKEEKDILEMILGDPIIIAAIVGGIIVILLSVILLFLFVVYRLKKKDEGSYSLDEPAKSKDPTAYWKETKEFYA